MLTVSYLVPRTHVPDRGQIAAAAARENEAMAELIGTGANADALAALLQR
jgi:hypothetical protein